MICYICNCDVAEDLQTLIAHYKIIDLLKPVSLYTFLKNSFFQSDLIACDHSKGM